MHSLQRDKVSHFKGKLFPIFYDPIVQDQATDLNPPKTQVVLKSSKMELNCTFAISSSMS